MATVHELRRTLHEKVFYPEHPPRKASAEYERTRHHLIVELDTPCFICGVRQSTLDDPSLNPDGATAMELHHWEIEWALCDAVDPTKLTPFFPEVVDRASLERFLDSAENGKVLCNVHHRHIERGIHTLEYPVWIAQKYVRDGYQLTDERSDTNGKAQATKAEQQGPVREAVGGWQEKEEVESCSGGYLAAASPPSRSSRHASEGQGPRGC